MIDLDELEKLTWSDWIEVDGRLIEPREAIKELIERVRQAEARIAEAAKHTAAVLDRLDEMNNGQISYEVYSELHDLVALGLNEGENDAAYEYVCTGKDIQG